MSREMLRKNSVRTTPAPEPVDPWGGLAANSASQPNLFINNININIVTIVKVIINLTASSLDVRGFNFNHRRV